MLHLGEGNTDSEFRPIYKTWDSFSMLLGRRVLMSQQDPRFMICLTRTRNTLTRSVSILWTHMVHMNHLQLVTELFQLHHHGLRKNDILRKDRQNWASAQKLTFLRAQNYLQQIEDGIDEVGRPPDPFVLGSLVYLRLVWYYVEIFFSSVANLCTPISSLPLFRTFWEFGGTSQY